MSDSYSISYSVDSPKPSNPSSQHSSDSPLVAFATCDLVPVNSELLLMISRETGQQQMIASQVVEALKTCVQFRSIDHHTSRLCATRPELKGQEGVVRQTLQQLTDSGFLTQAASLRDRLDAEVAAELAPTRIFVITCDRPEQLQRLLESMLRSAGLSTYEALFLIDDSKLAESREQNQAVLDRFNSSSAIDMQYLGAAEQDELLHKLIDELPGHEEGIRFLIDPDRWRGCPTYGRSRTLALMHSFGRRLIVLDDDILCQAVLPAVPEEGVFIGSNGAREASFFTDRESLISAGALHEKSPLDLHNQYLGRPLGSTLKSLAGGAIPIDWFTGGNAAMTNIWSADSKVLVTQCGAWGDPGTGDAHWILNLSEHSISRLLTAGNGMAAAVEDRNAWLGAPNYSVMKIAFMSQMTGLDNTELLPPYFTAFRGEDLLFASLVEALHPQGAVLECGFAVPHLPENRSVKSIKEPIASAGGVGLFASYLTNQIDYTDASEPEERIGMIAADLRRLTTKSNSDLLLDYRREVAKAQASLLNTVSNQQANTRDFGSANWQGYLDRAVSELQAALQREWSPKDIKEVSNDASLDEIFEGFRNMVTGYAAALDAWPSIRERLWVSG
ncbi:MAG: hypothetical protein AAGH40_14700 [Verrucomicrobiota bacterium]